MELAFFTYEKLSGITTIEKCLRRSKHDCSLQDQFKWSQCVKNRISDTCNTLINPNHWISGKMGVSLLICSVDAKYVVFKVSRFESSKLKPKALGCHSTIQYSLCYSIWYIVSYKKQFSSCKHSINCALKFAVPFSKTDSEKQK